jgi:predicted TIM-barrel fold metal-dependent hydrolase
MIASFRWLRCGLLPCGWLIGLLLALCVYPAAAEPYKGRLFDGHLHYSHQAWDVLDAKAAMQLLDDAEVHGALTSSTPDEGTQRLLAEKHPRVRIVPLYRPYTPEAGSGSWYKRPAHLDGAEAAMEAALHHGLGEVHIHAPVILETARIRKLVQRVADLGLFIQPHSDFQVVEKIFEVAPRAKVVWAHAGFSDPPAVIGRLMDKHANLWADLSYREMNIITADGIDPEWRTLLIRHADRFMIGSDTWAPDRWHAFPSIIEENRMWLGDLPKDVADKIAHQNGERLFGLH